MAKQKPLTIEGFLSTSNPFLIWSFGLIMRQLNAYAGVYTTVTRGEVTDREEECEPSERLAAPLALNVRATV